MQRKLTITIADDVYRGLHQQIGRGEISRFIEGLVRTYLTSTDDLEAEYRASAADNAAEQDATDWIEAHVDEALD
jgi:predicted CopG family antitoxin